MSTEALFTKGLHCDLDCYNFKDSNENKLYKKQLTCVSFINDIGNTLNS